MNTVFLAILLSVGIAAPVWAEGFNAKQVPVGVQWFLHLDVGGFKKTQLGKFVLEQSKEFSEELDAVAEELKIDVRTDLESATMFGNVTTEGQENMAILFKGNFKAKAILGMIRKLNEFKQRRSGGHEFFSWLEDSDDEEAEGEPETVFAAIVNDGLIALGSSQHRLVQALNVLKGKAPALQPKQLAGLQLNKGDYFLAGVVKVKDLPVPPQARVFNVHSLGFRLGEKDKQILAHVRLNSANAESGLQIQQMLQGMLALNQLQIADTEEPGAKEISMMLKNLKIVRNKNVLEVDVAFPVAHLLELIKLDIQHDPENKTGSVELELKANPTDKR